MSVCFPWPQLGRRQHACIWIRWFCSSSVGVPVGALQVGLICGSVWQLSPWLGRYLCQSTVNFMLLLLKHSFPNWASSSSHWLNFSIWSRARFFSLGNHVLHQKIYCHKKTKLFLRALFGIWNSSPSLELNFPSDAYFRKRQTSIETGALCSAESSNPQAVSS